MDLEEQKIQQRIEVRQAALQEKLDRLKERLEYYRRLGGVTTSVRHRPGVMVTGSVLAGFLARKFLCARGRYPRNSYRTAARKPARASALETLGGLAGALLSLIFSRPGLAVLTAVLGKSKKRS